MRIDTLIGRENAGTEHYLVPVVVVDVFCGHVVRVLDAHVGRVRGNDHGGESGWGDPIGAYFECFVRAHSRAGVPNIYVKNGDRQRRKNQ